MRVPARQIQQQLESVFTAWGMSAAHAATTAQLRSSLRLTSK